MFKLPPSSKDHNHHNKHFDCQQTLDGREVALDVREWRIVEVFHRGLHNFHTRIGSNHPVMNRRRHEQAECDFADIKCIYSRMYDGDRDNDVVCPILSSTSWQPSSSQASWALSCSSQWSPCLLRVVSGVVKESWFNCLDQTKIQVNWQSISRHIQNTKHLQENKNIYTAH